MYGIRRGVWQGALVASLGVATSAAHAAFLTEADIQRLINSGAFSLNFSVPNTPGPQITSTPISFRAATEASGMAVAQLAAPVTFTVRLLGVRQLEATINSLTLNPDPVVTWSLTANNFSTTTLPYLFVFGTPLSPTLSGPTVATSQISGSLTDNTRNGITLNPLVGAFVQNPTVSPSLISTNAPSGGAFSRSSTAGTGPITYTYNLASAGPVAGPSAGPYNLLTTTVSFTLTGLGDRAALTGNATIDPVPLPAAAWLMLSGLAGIGLLARRGNRT